MMYLSNSFGPTQREKVASGEYAGWLVSPQTYGIPQGIKSGECWAGDNGCFTDSWTERRFTEWLMLMFPYSDTCLFMVAPDKLGDWKATWNLWHIWQPRFRRLGFPAAYVGQDGQPVDWIPWDTMDVYFVGGTDDWKDTAESLALVTLCRRAGIPVHLGRGNTRPRLEAFFKAYKFPGDKLGPLPGFTFDGNGIRMPGKNRELADAFAKLQMEWLL
jgi:hypothetical protein